MKNQAFTLIELLVVVLIIGILAAIAVPQYQKSVIKSRISEAITAIRLVADSEEVYYTAHSAYTNNFDKLDFNIGKKVASGRSLASFWDIKLTEINYNYIFAGSTTDASGSGYGNERWYIYYHLDNKQFFCCAHKNSTEKNKLCLSLTNNATSQNIESDPNLKCYPLKL